MVSIGNCILGETPRVAIAIRDGVSRTDIDTALKCGGDMIELRVDHFSQCSSAFVCNELQRFSNIPRIGTIRSASEGGSWRGTSDERQALFKAIIPFVDAVDIHLHWDETQE